MRKSNWLIMLILVVLSVLSFWASPPVMVADNQVSQASLFGDIWDWIVGGAIGLVGLGSIIVAAGVWLFKKFVKPSIDTQEELTLWQKALSAADEITDILVSKFPNAKWDDWLNEAVDKIIIEVEDITLPKKVQEKYLTEMAAKRALALKAANAALAKKKAKGALVIRTELKKNEIMAKVAAENKKLREETGQD